MSSFYDAKAVKILFETHWTSKGWRVPPFVTPPADLTYATSQGVMFPPVLLPHDATRLRLRQLCASMAPSALGDAFLASLTSGELVLRSALGSFAVARHFPDHPFDPDPVMDYCTVCGLFPAPTAADAVDLSKLNFYRLKWGGSDFTQLAYQLLDLEEFRKLTPPAPTKQDALVFQNILAIARSLPPGAKFVQLEKALAGVLRASKEERRKIIEILCLCGVLSYPGYRHYFDPGQPPKGRSLAISEWPVPMPQWRGADGYNLEHLREYFPNHLPEA
jgi:hypothetical protein